MKVLVTGATGTVGKLVVRQLLKKGNSEVTALVRSRERADFPHNVRVEVGDLSKAETCKKALDGQDVLFLLLTFDGDPELMDLAKRAGIKKIVAIQDGTAYPIENQLKNSGILTVMLYPVEFMKNTLIFWKDSIQYEGVAKTPFPDAKGAQIHEKDIADVAVVTITETGHEGKSYYLTGPETITPRIKAEVIAEVTGSPVKLVVQTEAEARADYASWGFTSELIDYAIESSKEPEPWMYQVLPTVEELTGHPARTFRMWVSDHRKEFVPTLPKSPYQV